MSNPIEGHEACVRALREARQDAVRLQAILEGLFDTYKPEGVGIWLSAPHKMLDGRSALDAIREGDVAEVLALVDQLTSGAFV